MEITHECKILDGVPSILVYNRHFTCKMPVIILLHGLNETKETHIKEAYEIAKSGYCVILYDAPEHGELQPEKYKDLDFWQKASHIPEFVVESTYSIQKLISQLSDISFCNCQNIGLIGFSMGGSTIYNYFINFRNVCPYIKFVVVMCATPLWYSALKKNQTQLRLEYAEQKNSNILELEIEDLADILENIPLLMLNFRGDMFAPINDVKLLYNLGIKKVSSWNINLIEYKGVYHKITNEMVKDSIEFIKNI